MSAKRFQSKYGIQLVLRFLCQSCNQIVQIVVANFSEGVHKLFFINVFSLNNTNDKFLWRNYYV